MKLIDGIKQTGKTVDILGTSRNDLPELFQQLGYKRGAEIGVFKGTYTELFCKAGLFVFGIDPWLAYDEYANQIGKNYQNQQKQDYICHRAMKTLAPYKNIQIIKKTSMEAVKEFEDESLDFVYIDGHHGFKYVAEDIYEWSKKIRKGGAVCGHDYVLDDKLARSNYLDVVFVVDAYIRCFDIKTLYLLGNRDHITYGKLRNWMWFKE